MGKISKVYYKEIPDNVCSVDKAGEFYFHHNMVGIDEMFQEGYSDYEASQICLRNELLGEAMKKNEIPSHPNSATSILGISSIKNKTVLVVEY